jgi:hypothetical protein
VKTASPRAAKLVAFSVASFLYSIAVFVFGMLAPVWVASRTLDDLDQQYGGLGISLLLWLLLVILASFPVCYFFYQWLFHRLLGHGTSAE